MAFDTWSAWGVRKNEQDIIFVNIEDHNVSQLGTRFAKFIIEQYSKDTLHEINEVATQNLQSKIKTPEDIICKDGKKFLRKLMVKNLLNTPEVTQLKYWGAVFAQESYNPNFLLTHMHYRVDFSNYLHLSDITCCAYIFNLDNNELEIYFGFNERIGAGRYGQQMHPFIKTQFYGVNLIKSIPLADLLQLNERFSDDWLLTAIVPDNTRLMF